MPKFSRTRILLAKHGFLSKKSIGKLIKPLASDALSKLAATEHLAVGFSRVLKHDVRRPITELRGHISTLERRGGEPKKIFRAIENAGFLSTYTKRIIERHKKGIEFLPAVISFSNLAASIKRLVEINSSAEFGKAVTFSSNINFRNRNTKIFADDIGLLRVATNLLTNAFDAMEYGKELRMLGVVGVNLRLEGNGLHLTVSDNGRGMTAEQLRKVRQKLTEDTSFTSKTGNRGIGLNNVREIVKAHRGRLSVKSELGKGTEFDVEIPVKGKAKAQ
ncbi:MAG: ATP-binding protein [Candidatus Diapherotrites archaeon]